MNEKSPYYIGNAMINENKDVEVNLELAIYCMECQLILGYSIANIHDKEEYKWILCFECTFILFNEETEELD
jgi:hypothetical protein